MSNIFDTKEYRKYMTSNMDENEFVRRLKKAFEHESRIHPESIESVYHGENDDLIWLVAKEYQEFLDSSNINEKIEDSSFSDDMVIDGRSELDFSSSSGEVFIEDENEDSISEEEISFEEQNDFVDTKPDKNIRKKLERQKQEQYILNNELKEQKRFEELRHLEEMNKLQQQYIDTNNKSNNFVSPVYDNFSYELNEFPNSQHIDPNLINPYSSKEIYKRERY